MNLSKVDNLFILATKTILGFTVFFVALYAVPLYNQFKNSDVVLAFIHQKDAVIGETSLKIVIADTPKERGKGLSGKDDLESKEGLFFIFDKDDYHGIWMKDMNFAIDIIWLDSTMQIVDFKEKVHPSTFPEVFEPNKKARYVLEVPAGFFLKNHLKLYDEMTIL